MFSYLASDAAQKYCDDACCQRNSQAGDEERLSQTLSVPRVEIVELRIFCNGKRGKYQRLFPKAFSTLNENIIKNKYRRLRRGVFHIFPLESMFAIVGYFDDEK